MAMEMKTLVQKLKVVLFFMGVVSVVCLTLNSLPSYAQDDADMKTLIVYYSRTGNTKTACETLQQELGCDIREIKDLKSRAGGWGFFTAALGSMFNTHTKIDPEHPDLASYGAVIIGSPVWAGRPAAAIRTFIANNKFDGKKVVMFTTTNVSEKEGSKNKVKKMVMQSGGQVVGYFQIAVTEKANGEKIERPQSLIMEDAVKLAAEVKKSLTQ
jgi:flavodoxin